MEFYEGSGIAARPTKDFGVISANIGGSPENLKFTRCVFYSFGIRCEGSLTNVLEEGMEVDFCYKLSSGKPQIVAVWLGDEPDLTTDILDGVYSQSGRVCQVLDDYYLIQAEDMPHTVVVNHDVVYPDSLVLSVGDYVRFDAMPLGTKHESGAVYHGTCAWIGQEPILASRFGLAMSEPLHSQDTVEVHNDNHVHGTVVVIPCDTVAIVEVPGFRKKAVLFRRSFHQNCERIQDTVRVGDTVCMIIRSRCKLWFAAKAYKECVELRDEISGASERNPKNGVLFRDEISGGSERNPKNDVLFRDESLGASERNPKNDVLFSDPPLQGVITQSFSDTEACISYGPSQLMVCCRLSNVFIRGKPCKTIINELELLAGTAVNFEGIASSPIEAKARGELKRFSTSHEATLVWIGKRPSLLKVAATFQGLRRYDGSVIPPQYLDQHLVGVVKVFYLPDIALMRVRVGDMAAVVCLHVDAFEPTEGRGRYISDFVCYDEYFKFRVKRNPQCKVGFCAYDLEKSTAEAYRTFCASSKGWVAAQKPALQAPAPKPNPMLERAEIMFENPPLTGDLKWLSNTKAVIVYQGTDVELKCHLFFHGRACFSSKFKQHVLKEKTKKGVNFEGIRVPLSETDLEVYATLGWIGKRPSLVQVAEDFQGPPVIDAQYLDRTLVGCVLILYLPDTALMRVKIGKKSALVCVHVTALEPAETTGRYIFDFVWYDEYYKFRVKRNPQCSVGFCAYDLEKSTAEAYKTFCALSKDWADVSSKGEAAP